MTPDFNTVDLVVVILAVVAICLIYFAKRVSTLLPGDPAEDLLLEARMARLKSGGAIVYPRTPFGGGYFLLESEIEPYLDWSARITRRGLKVFGWGYLSLFVISAFVDFRFIDLFVLVSV